VTLNSSSRTEELIMHSTSPVVVPGPLAPFTAGFDAELARLGYTPDSAYGQLRLAAELSAWLAGAGMGLAEVTAETLEVFLAGRRACGHSRGRTGRAFAPLVAYLRGLDAVPPGAEAAAAAPEGRLLARYRSYLISERGLQERTCRGYVHLVRPFLAARVIAGTLDLESMTSADVTGFLVQVSRGSPARTCQATATALRSLLRFLHLDGQVPASWKLAGLPRGLEPAQVRALLASCDPGSAIGVRDHAILIMLARLALRAAELSGLLLDDIRWRSGQVVIRGKGHRHDILPLPPDVGDALAGYLQAARPRNAADRHLFIRARAPLTGLASTGITVIVAAAGRRADVESATPHRLRHSAATSILRAGAGLGEVGQLLRHVSPMTTALYAKTDLQALQPLARPWPAAPAGGGAS
jgi:site-specific recombinase XerD